MQIEDNVLLCYEGQETITVIPDGVTKIGDWAFSDTQERSARRNSAFEARKERTLEKVIFPQSLKQIGKGAFHKETHLKEVIFSEGLEVIKDLAFAHCPSLTEISLPESIQVLSNHAFVGCEALIKVVIPHTVRGCIAPGTYSLDCISEGLFSRCYALKEVSIPAGIRVVGKEAFWNCQALESISIPDSVEEIGDRAFEHCISVREISVPKNVKTIGGQAFPHGEHSNLERILVSPENKAYCSIDGVLYSKDLKTLILCPVNYTKTVFKVPVGVEEISPYAFEGCKKIRKVVIPESVVRIGERAFSRMYNLKTAVLPSALNILEKEVFAYCVKLSDMQWPKVPFGIGEGCFRQTGFGVISLPETVTSVGNYAFASNPHKFVGMITERREKPRVKAEKVYLPKSVVSVGLSAFYGAKEIEVYDTVDSDAKPAEEYPLLGGFNGRLGSVGIYQQDGYAEAAFNSYWYDHVIIVRSSIDDTVKYRIRMPDGQKREVYCTFATAWGKNASFNFKATDGVFDEMTPDAKLDYAMDRLRYPEGIEEQFHEQLVEYINKRAKAIITKIIERDSSSDLSYFSKYGIIKKRAVSGYIAQAREACAIQCEQWFAEQAR